MTTRDQADALSRDDRWLLAICAVVAAGAHVPLIGDHLREVPYLGWCFIGFVAASLMAAVAVLTVHRPWIWASVGILNASAVLVYLASRTVGLPAMTDDIGNWTEPWSFPALTAEAISTLIVLRTHGWHRPTPRAKQAL